MEEKKYLSNRERVVFGLAAFGQGALYAMMTSWLSRFYTDVLGLELLFVMGLMWVARLLFAVGDPLMGVLVDNTRSKYGKMRHYLLFAPFIVSLLSVFLFIDFGLDMTGKMIYASVTYIVWGIAYSICDVPFWGMPHAMTPNVTERDKFLSFARTLNCVGGALPVAIVAFLIGDSILGLKNGLMAGAILFSAVAIVPFSLTFFFTRERIEPQKEKLTVKQSFGVIGKCRPLILVMLFGLLSFGRYMLQASYTYAADYVFVYHQDANWFTTFVYNARQIIGTALIGIAMFPTMIIMPKLLKKYNSKQLSIGAGVFSGAVLGLFFLVGKLTDYNFYVALPFFFLSGLPLGIYNIILFSMVGECVDYLHYKFNIRAEGLTSSCISFVGKLSAAFSAGAIPLVLELSDYIQPVIENGQAVIQTQSESTRTAIFSMLTLIPACSFIVASVPILWYDLVGKKKQEIEQELSKKRVVKEEFLDQ